MDLTAIIKELVEERELVEQAIDAMEKMAAHRGKRRGRPPEWLKAIEKAVAAPPKRGRPASRKGAAKAT